MRQINIILCLVFAFSIVSCKRSNSETTQVEVTENSDSIKLANRNQTPGLGYEFENNGKNHEAPLFTASYKDTVITGIEISASAKLNDAIKGSERYLRSKKRSHRLSDELKTNDIQIKKTIAAIKDWQVKGGELSEFVNMYQTDGEDGRGNVHFTGYYIPVLKVKKKKDDVFKYPLYRKPTSWKGKMPTREEINEDGVLKGKGLELCYSDNILDIYTMQVQGSGMVEYPDGSQKLLSYGGKNGYAYKSLGKYLVSQGHVPADKISLDAIRKWTAENPDSLTAVLNNNPSYVFFKETKNKPSGAASVPLVAKHSVAVDKSLIPLGSVMLGEVPVLNDEGELLRHEYRLLFAHDVGGAIKKGHIDFYSGVGLPGERVANALHHYGRVWVLLTK
jgi:membrane-bound lytic murein transglycosylase A